MTDVTTKDSTGQFSSTLSSTNVLLDPIWSPGDDFSLLDVRNDVRYRYVTGLQDHLRANCRKLDIPSRSVCPRPFTFVWTPSQNTDTDGFPLLWSDFNTTVSSRKRSGLKSNQRPVGSSFWSSYHDDLNTLPGLPQPGQLIRLVLPIQANRPLKGCQVIVESQIGETTGLPVNIYHGASLVERFSAGKRVVKEEQHVTVSGITGAQRRVFGIGNQHLGNFLLLVILWDPTHQDDAYSVRSSYQELQINSIELTVEAGA